MRQTRVRTTAAFLAGIALLGAALVGCTSKDEAKPSGQAATPVQLGAAKPGSIQNVLTYSGAIQSSQQVNITPRTAGQISGIFVDVGTAVRVGDRLARIDAGTLSSQVAGAQANVAAAQARLDGMLVGSKAADITAAQSAYDAALAKYNQLQTPLLSDLSTAEAAVATAKAAADNSVSAAANAKATLLANIYVVCNQGIGITISVPCNNITLPLLKDVTDAVASNLTSGVGTIGATPGLNSTALLAANAAYVTALNNTESANQGLATAKIKRDQLLNPSPSDLAALRSAVDSARSNLENKRVPYTESDIRAAQAAVAQAQAALGTASTLLDQTSVIAPFDGVITQKLLEAGAGASPATPIFVLAARAVEVRLTVEEGRIALVKPDLQADLTVAAFPGKKFSGKIASVAPTGDARAHTFEVKVLAGDPNAQLKAGMFAEVSMVTAQKNDALLVPANAVLQGKVVTVVDGKAVFKAVQTGLADQANVEITGGLKAGDQIVVVGQQSVRDGQAVAVTTNATAGASPTATPSATAKP